MGKIIIDVHDNIPDDVALSRVLSVVSRGKVSIGAKGKKHYCWLTIFNDIYVHVSPKHHNDNEKFTVGKEEQ